MCVLWPILTSYFRPDVVVSALMSSYSIWRHSVCSDITVSVLTSCTSMFTLRSCHVVPQCTQYSWKAGLVWINSIELIRWINSELIQDFFTWIIPIIPRKIHMYTAMAVKSLLVTPHFAVLFYPSTTQPLSRLVGQWAEWYCPAAVGQSYC